MEIANFVARSRWLLDRRLLVRSVFDTLGRVGLGPFVRAQWSADTAIAQIGFDREKGGRVLDSLGWRAGADGARARDGHRLEFTLLVPPSPSRQRMAVLIQEQLRLAGVAVQIEKLDGNAMSDRAGKRAFDALMGGWTATPSPSGINQTWTTAAAQGGGLNWGRYENSRFDAQVDSAMIARSKAAAMTHYRAAYQIMVDDAPVIWLYEAPALGGDQCAPPHRRHARRCVVDGNSRMVHRAGQTACARFDAGDG